MLATVINKEQLLKCKMNNAVFPPKTPKQRLLYAILSDDYTTCSDNALYYAYIQY